MATLKTNLTASLTLEYNMKLKTLTWNQTLKSNMKTKQGNLPISVKWTVHCKWKAGDRVMTSVHSKWMTGNCKCDR
jgi:hypothetical protein